LKKNSGTGFAIGPLVAGVIFKPSPRLGALIFQAVRIFKIPVADVPVVAAVLAGLPKATSLPVFLASIGIKLLSADLATAASESFHGYPHPL